MHDGLIASVILIPLLVVVVFGIWRATAVQKGTGCPCCDKHLSESCTHHGEGKDATHEAGKSAGRA